LGLTSYHSHALAVEHGTIRFNVLGLAFISSFLALLLFITFAMGTFTPLYLGSR
jgi:Na+-transporting methylmalonyl-CoA/oxaloacetate decarboxylase gamma subunit